MAPLRLLEESAVCAMATVLILAAIQICDSSLFEETSVLLAFKMSIVEDPNGAMTSWNSSTLLSPCEWYGITCDAYGNAVTGISLSNSNLLGIFSAVVCEISNLAILHLDNNSLGGRIPPELTDCVKLQSLDLSNNYLTGSIPVNIFKLQSLTYLNLSLTSISGVVPVEIGLLPDLQALDLSRSMLTGTWPPELGNLSKLTILDLGYNPFIPANIPSSLGNLSNLEALSLQGCQLVGGISPSLGNLQKLVNLDLSRNSLVGDIPNELMSLGQLKRLELFLNKLSGSIPVRIANLLSLTDLDLSGNGLTGSIPEGIGELLALQLLHLQNNSLTGQIPESLVRLRSLKEIRLFDNRLTATIPGEFGSKSPLSVFDVSSNSLSGVLPETLCVQGHLKDLILFGNNLSGSLPSSYAACPTLRRVRIYDNNFMANVPSGIWGSPNLLHLDIHNNKLGGSVGPSIRNATKLMYIDLSDNKFVGSLPREIGQLQNLSIFFASNNQLSGQIPWLEACPQLLSLSLSRNSFSGDVPGWISRCPLLNSLYLSDNRLSGPIPRSLAKLTNLNYLDLSRNRLSGEIPSSLARMKLVSFNVSFNNLSGPVPSVFSPHLFETSVEGNPGLCGISLLHPCTVERTNSRGGWPKTSLLLVLAVLTAACLLSLAVHILHRRRSRVSKSKWIIVSFHKLNFKVRNVIQRLEEGNVVGTGASGKVYCARVDNGGVVAVKKLWKCESDADGPSLLADNGFKAEIGILGRIRHRNILKLLCCCSNEETNLLVYEYMTNGSLGDILHGPKPLIELNWPRRYRIALGAAQGIAYLHHDCVPQVLHRDIKSNNILLDAEFEVHIGDFGLARLLGERSLGATESVSMVAGSYGYIAPEYAYTLKVSEKTDVFSYGVVLLELVTGKMPIDPQFYGEDGNIVKWVAHKCHSKEEALSIVDPKLALTIEAFQLPQVIRLLRIAMLCTAPFPSGRPSMRQVIEYLICPSKLLDSRCEFH